MPRGIPNDPSVKRGGWHVTTKDDLKQRMREIEQRIKQMERREKSLGDLKKWLANRKLEVSDLMWMVREMKPKRADAPVKSKNPLKPPSKQLGYFMSNGKLIAPKGDPEFRRRIKEARIAKGWNFEDVAKKIGGSHQTIASWEAGRFIPKEVMRAKIVKVLDLPAGLGAEATAAMEGSYGKNGAAASP
jgi:ribosome-binding protein aMBF1 (putative translation factor)